MQVTGKVLLCGSCKFGPLVPVLDMGEQPLPQARPGFVPGQRFPLRLVQCPRCLLVQLDYIVPQELVFPADYPYVTGNTKALVEHFAQQAREVAAIVPSGGLVIDIGGNDGTMLLELRELLDTDVRLLLIEPTNQARKAAAAGIDTEQEYFTAELAEKVRQGYGAADVITASSVFGHVPDPHDFLDGVTTLLASDGTLIIDNQDWYNVVNLLQVDTIYHEHLRYYSPASLGYLLEKHGLIVTDLNRIGMHGGSFRAVVRRQKPRLQARAETLVRVLTRIMDEATTDGLIYAVGAPTRATPLVNYARLDRYLTCACEIATSEKIGARIPGTTVPVVDEACLFTDQPAYALLLAWDLAGTLIPLLRRKGYRGRFILPLPEPRVTLDLPTSHEHLKAEYTARLAVWSDIQEQMPLLYDAARSYDHPVIAELGTRGGNSTVALLAGAAERGGHVWSVDNGPAPVPAWWHETGVWSFLPADDMSPEAALFLPVGLDILFIDTSHVYEHTLAELRKYVPRVRPGGVVLCHDTELTSYQMAQYGDARGFSGPTYPVAAALDVYCAETGLTWTRQTDRPAPAPGRPFYGLGIIAIPG